MAVPMKQRRGTAAAITAAAPTPASGELVFETDTLRFKVGDGATAWASLAYVLPYLSATDKILGRSSAGAGPAQEITCTAAGRALLDDADAAAQRTTLSVQPTANPTFTTSATVEGTTRGALHIRGLFAGATDIGGINFQNAASTTVFRVYANCTDNTATSDGYITFAAAAAGVLSDRLRVLNTGISVTGTITASAGSAASPAIQSGTGTADCGIYWPAADSVSISTAGSERVRFKPAGAVRFVPLSADPSTAEAGDVYYHSGLQKLRVYNGSRWVSISGAAWDISTAEYVHSFSVSAQETSPNCVVFRPDGLKMYTTGSAGDSVYEYDLAVAWDISTATHKQTKSVSAQETTPTAIFFKPDGLKMFVLGATGDDVNEYTLSTAWDVSTATYVQVFSVSSQETTPTGLFFKPDGLKMYVVGLDSDTVREYTLSTAWDISTATYSQGFSVGTEDASPRGLFFRADGLRMYVCGDTGNEINQYSLSTAWDVSTAAYQQVRSVSAQDTQPSGVWFSTDGLRMYLVGFLNDSVYQYALD